MPDPTTELRIRECVLLRELWGRGWSGLFKGPCPPLSQDTVEGVVWVGVTVKCMSHAHTRARNTTLAATRTGCAVCSKRHHHHHHHHHHLEDLSSVSPRECITLWMYLPPAETAATPPLPIVLRPARPESRLRVSPTDPVRVCRVGVGQEKKGAMNAHKQIHTHMCTFTYIQTHGTGKGQMCPQQTNKHTQNKGGIHSRWT